MVSVRLPREKDSPKFNHLETHQISFIFYVFYYCFPPVQLSLHMYVLTPFPYLNLILLGLLLSFHFWVKSFRNIWAFLSFEQLHICVGLWRMPCCLQKAKFNKGLLPLKAFFSLLQGRTYFHLKLSLEMKKCQLNISSVFAKNFKTRIHYLQISGKKLKS